MIRLRTLGALDLRGSGGEEVRAVLAQPRRAALLTYLALATPRGPQLRDKLLALFWPELDSERARNALGQALHFLRRSLGADAIVNRDNDALGVDWNNFWCDAVAFEEALDGGRVAEAVGLYRGDLLDGFHIGDAPEFERWLDGERARLGARYTKAVESLAAEREAAADHQGAVVHWQLLAARDPYSSRLTVRLMRALVAAGDPAAALVQARQHEKLVREEMGISPDAEVVALVRKLQDGSSVSPSRPLVIPSEARNPHVLLQIPRIARDDAVPRPPTPEPFYGSRRRLALVTAGLVMVAVVVAAFATRRPSDATRERAVGLVPAGDSARSIVANGGHDPLLMELYQRGRQAEITRSLTGLQTARLAYEQAIARDSSFALGYAGLSGIHGFLGAYAFAPLRPSLDSARIMARRAFQLDSNSAESRAALAVTLVDAHDFAGAERQLKRAIELDSTNVRAHYWYAMLLVILGRGDEAQLVANRGAALDRNPPRGLLAVQRYALWQRTGERPYRKIPVRERRPMLKQEPGEPWARAREAEDLAQEGNCDEARKEIEAAQHLAPNNVKMRVFLGRVYWWCGEQTAARALLEGLKQRPDADTLGFDIALLHTLFGEKDSALEWLKRRRGWMMGELAMLSAAHYLDPLREEPEFKQLLVRLGMRKAPFVR